MKLDRSVKGEDIRRWCRGVNIDSILQQSGVVKEVIDKIMMNTDRESIWKNAENTGDRMRLAATAESDRAIEDNGGVVVAIENAAVCGHWEIGGGRLRRHLRSIARKYL